MFSFDKLLAVYKVVVLSNHVSFTEFSLHNFNYKIRLYKVLAGLRNIALTSQCALRDILY